MDTDLASFLLGILTTMLFAVIPYNRSTQQLRKEADRLAKISTTLSRALEHSGIGKFNRNKIGEPIGLIYNDLTSERAKASDEIIENPDQPNSSFKPTN